MIIGWRNLRTFAISLFPSVSPQIYLKDHQYSNVSRRKSTFSASSYAAFRPIYPASLYDKILKYYAGRPRQVCVDLGCGHGVVASYLAGFFDRVVGVDPSAGMIEQAKEAAAAMGLRNVEYRSASAEELPFLEDGSVDLVTAGQAAHWFDQAKLWPELKRVMRKQGTLAFWGYKDHVFVGYPNATRVLDEYAYGQTEDTLGPYWSQPGRSKVQDKLRAVRPPAADWEDICRLEYEPGADSDKQNMFLSKTMTLGDCMKYIRTWSSWSAWQDAHPDKSARDNGGKGDVVDEMFDAMRAVEKDWQEDHVWKEKQVDIEWGSALILARKKDQ